MAEQAPRLYEDEVAFVAASLVQHCVAREEDRPSVQQRLCDMFLRNATDLNTFLTENDELLRRLYDAAKIALKRMHKGFKKGISTLESVEDRKPDEANNDKDAVPRISGKLGTSRQLFSCGSCGKKFTLKSNLDRHKTFHTGVKPYKCDECPKGYTRKAELLLHKKVHSGERVNCGECGKAFRDKLILSRHMPIHTLPFKCPICGKGLPRKEYVRRHIARVHKGSK